jgi:hypothetical protein
MIDPGKGLCTIHEHGFPPRSTCLGPAIDMVSITFYRLVRYRDFDVEVGHYSLLTYLLLTRPDRTGFNVRPSIAESRALETRFFFFRLFFGTISTVTLPSQLVRICQQRQPHRHIGPYRVVDVYR